MQEQTKARARTPLILSLTAGVSLCVCLIACRPQRSQKEVQTQQAQQTRRYELKGKVISIDKTQKQLVVDGEEIPGFMSAMTMPYSVKDARLLDSLGPGDQITAQVVVSNDSAWLENIVVVKKGEETKSPPSSQLHVPQEGEEVPNFALLNQDDKRIELRDYRGKFLLITFIYTRCPFPDFCPLMTHNFAEIEKALAKNPQDYSKTHLLTISFDPEYDTPQVLRAYGAKYLLQQGKHAFDHWEFAVTPEADLKRIDAIFGISSEKEKGLLAHSLSTAMISPDGKIYKWYYSSLWEPKDVLKDLASSLTQ